MILETPISSFEAWPKMMPTDHFSGGPRGQLAVHPAAAQFVLDNASSNLGPGINAVDEILNMLPEDRGGAHYRYPPRPNKHRCGKPSISRSFSWKTMDFPHLCQFTLG